MEKSHALLCARDPAIIEAVEVSAAALDVPLVVERDSSQVRAQWAAAALRLVSTEVAARWSSVGDGLAYVIGTDPGELARCSSELGLPVLPLPDDGGRLAQALSSAAVSSQPRGTVVALVGASGGLGASTLVASLTLLGAAAGKRAVAVDLAPCSGGLDLIVGGERSAGLRWSDLAQARGELGALTLPTVDGAGFLTADRRSPGPPGKGAVGAVVSSLARTAELVVVDAGREPPPVECDRTFVLVGADVRSVAAARMLAETHSFAPAGVIVRTGPGRTLPVDVVARSLGVESLGSVPEDRALPRLGELGLLPTAGQARKYRRRVKALLGELLDG